MKPSNELLSIYNPDKQTEYCTQRERCIVGVAPRMKEVMEVHGTKIAETWLSIQLFNLSEYFGCKEKLDKMQIDFLSKSLAWEYRGLRLTEFMLVFYDMKMGKYGKMFGAVDPCTISEAFDKYHRGERQKVLYEHRKKTNKYETVTNCHAFKSMNIDK